MMPSCGLFFELQLSILYFLLRLAPEQPYNQSPFSLLSSIDEEILA